jgi:hypothetical protein
MDPLEATDIPSQASCWVASKPSQVRTVLRSANTVTKKLELQPLRKYRKGVIG